MTHRAVFAPFSWKRNLLLAAAMGSAVVLVGCGGGGGGGNNGGGGFQDVCGSALNSGTTVICGYVLNANGVAVPGSTVHLRDAAGNALAGATGVTDSTGLFKITSPPTTARFFDVSPAAGYWDNTVDFTSGGVTNTYAYYRTTSSGTGQCYPPLPAISTGHDNRIGTMVVSSSSTPPPPPKPCPY